MIFKFALVLIIYRGVLMIGIDNDIVGDPDIECLDEQIRFFVKTRNIFNGRIYAKGKADNPDCSKDDFDSRRTKKPHVALRFGTCGMKSLRSVDPRGMYYGITLVVSFHTMFITKVDQAFHVKCFFEEASKGLTAELGVSMIATTEVEARHTIPGCIYTIHLSSIEDIDSGKPAGNAIGFARVGDRVLHQWHCDDQIFGILINNCYVTDGFGKRADIVDARGCAVDPILLSDLHYSSDLQRAYAESQVFKFADRPGVWFFCQIQMCMKSTGMCDGVTPPKCGSQESKINPIATKKKPGESNSEINEKTGEKGSYGSEYFDQNEETQNKPINKFGRVPPKEIGSLDNDFGPDFPVPPPLLDERGNNHRTKFNEQNTMRTRNPTTEVTTIFETDDYVRQGKPKKTISTGAAKQLEKGENGDYEELALPANLNEFLADLPEEINADSLQKMFKDSVEDRRSLLQGLSKLINENIESKAAKSTAKAHTTRSNQSGRVVDSVQVSWDSNRMADAPIWSNDNRFWNNARNEDNRDSNSSPMIGGQLIIYDLDEEPPNSLKLKSKQDSSITRTDCVMDRQKIYLIAAGIGCTAILLFVIVLLMLLHLSRTISIHKGSI